MTGEDLRRLKDWFSRYSQSFYSSDREDRRNLMMKVTHTEGVCENIVQIARGLSLSEQDTMIAETVALFHDIGRFRQYAQYRTFKDADSVNHGSLGVQVIKEEEVLQNLPDEERQLILQSVRFHNAYALATVNSERTLFFLKLIRDADKLDIYRVFLDYYESPEEDRASATAFGLKNLPDYSPEILSCVYKEEIASYAQLKSENDFKIMKLLWVYDMNFSPTLKLLLQRGYLDKIAAKLPRTDEISDATAYLQKYIAARLHDNGRN